MMFVYLCHFEQFTSILIYIMLYHEGSLCFIVFLGPMMTKIQTDLSLKKNQVNTYLKLILLNDSHLD
jgi:hypothetical protein